jgi:hypothetical protein
VGGAGCRFRADQPSVQNCTDYTHNYSPGDNILCPWKRTDPEGAHMEQRLFDGASFGPEVLKALTQAFDEAWLDIEGNFGDETDVVEVARLRLATSLLSVASEESRDVKTLKDAALQVMARNYRSLMTRQRETSK